MLERAVGCLESGSLRRLLPSSKQSVKSRRSLHSTFWDHGASDIELSPLWAALLRGPDHVDQYDTQQDKFRNGGGGVLLEFLYPAGTINFLRQYSGWGLDRPENRRGKLGHAGFGHRQYTSSAKDTSTKDGNSEAQDIEESVGSATIEPVDVQVLLKLLNSANADNYDEAWRRYLLLDEANQGRLRYRLIIYLTTSKLIVDAERVVELFQLLPEEERDPVILKAAIQSHLRLRDLSEAITLHQAAIRSFDSPDGADDLLGYMVENSLWSAAVETWKGVLEFRKRIPTIQTNPLALVKKIPQLSSRALELAVFVDRELESPKTSDAVTTNLLSFASRVVRCALFNDKFELSQYELLFSALRAWKMDNSELYDDMIMHLLNSKQSKSAVKLYRDSRLKKDTRVSRVTLHAILEVFCEHRSILGMQQVLDDFFRFFNTPTRRAYRQCMRVFASMGDAETVHALFEQYMSRFQHGKKPAHSSEIAPVLNVHAKRGELGETIRHFTEMEKKYGVKPDIICWNILLHAYARVNDVDGAFACFENLLATGLSADDYSFGTLMGICVSNGDLERTVEMYRLADRMGVEKSNAMVDCLVLGHVQDERFQEAERICEEALNMDLLRSRTQMWNHLLVAHAMRRDLVNVNRVLQRMSDANVEYDAYTYSALMLALVMVKQPDRAYDILKDVMRGAGIKPTAFHYALVMGGFIMTNEFPKVFHVHKRMERRGIRISASNKHLVMKAANLEDERLFAKGTLKEQSDHCFKIFQEVVGSMDPIDIVMTPRKGSGRLPVDMAQPTMFYNYIMFILAQRDKHVTVRQLYQQYIDTLPETRRDNPPIQILSALMVSKLREGDHESVQDCWNLALSQAKSQGSPLKQLNAVDQMGLRSKHRAIENKILPRHQLDLHVILGQYMRSLAKQQKVDTITTVVDGLLEEGFTLSIKNWNQYIGYLAKNLRFKLAFELCETKLMPGWTGWAHIRRQLPGRNALPIEIRHLKKDPKFLRPKYHTILLLGRCYLELEAMSAESKGNEMLLNILELDCPKTIRAIKTMERTDDEFERGILSGDSWQNV